MTVYNNQGDDIQSGDGKPPSSDHSFLNNQFNNRSEEQKETGPTEEFNSGINSFVFNDGFSGQRDEISGQRQDNEPDNLASTDSQNSESSGSIGSSNKAKPVGSNSFKPQLLLVLVLVCALIGALVGSIVTYAIGVNKTVIVKQFSPNISTIQQPTQVQVQALLKKILPAVVSINVNQAGGGSDQGTGVIISSNGEVITNNHVIAGASSIQVNLYNQSSPKKAVLVNTDTTDDVALLKIQNVSNLQTVNFSKSNNVQVGEWVLAIGNALALQGGPTVTEGIISAVGRTVPAGDISTGVTETLTNMLQTDAAINPGNSGGPLVDFNGNVVGINTAVASSSPSNAPAQNIGFAIPASKILSLIPVLQSGSVSNSSHGYLGVTIGDLTQVARSYYGIGPIPISGAVVESVVANSPAAQAGIQIGDVIVAVNSTTITSAQSLVNLIDTLQPNTSVNLSIYSGGFEYIVPVVLGVTPG